ncbi:MAG: hypothetical protein HOO06_09560 [Bdellovibrionaceae bacterium]|jgi:thiol-disulfide isomerase/thioredoxin|nr:hypothetical protein [Pseudobdellovibrionaceae bacterium]
MRTIIFVICFSVFPSTILAFDYFNGSIDYWNKKEVNQPKSKLPVKKQENAKKENAKEKFNWDRYINPKTTSDLKEVFREGKHTPPAPLLEAAQNPTDENIKNWFAVVKRKNQLMSRLNKRMAEYLKKSKGIKPAERNLIVAKQNKLQRQQVDFKRFRFRMYFESSCPHCKRMMSELATLQNMGFFVELRQIDNNKKYAKALPFVVSQAAKVELKEKKIDAWPVLFIGDTKKKLIYRINGYQSANDILLTLQSK